MSTFSFDTLASAANGTSANTYSSMQQAQLLPDEQKRQLVIDLIEEFGGHVAHIRERDGEVIHGCLVGPHNDQAANPTAAINYHSLLYRCLGCGAKGSLLWWIATCRGQSVGEATQWLDKEAGLGGHLKDWAKVKAFIEGLYAKPEKAPIPSYSEKMLAPWSASHPYLTDPKPAGRGLSAEQVARFKLGYAPAYQAYGRTSERIVLPHFWQGELVGWQTRRIHDDGTPKYLSSPDFPKDVTLYNYDRSHPRTVVVESMMSVVANEGEGLHLEATFGASVTSRQVDLLRKHPHLVLFMDNDPAGWAALTGRYEHKLVKGRKVWVKQSKGLIDLLTPYTRVEVASNPFDADPADMDPADVRIIVDHAVPAVAWSPPGQLYCYRCQQVRHSGTCEGR